MVGLLGSLKLAKLHLRGGLDVVHVHNMPDILALAGIFPQLTGSKLVLDVHDPMPELYMSWNHGERSLTVRMLRSRRPSVVGLPTGSFPSMRRCEKTSALRAWPTKRLSS